MVRLAGVKCAREVLVKIGKLMMGRRESGGWSVNEMGMVPDYAMKCKVKVK